MVGETGSGKTTQFGFFFERVHKLRWRTGFRSLSCTLIYRTQGASWLLVHNPDESQPCQWQNV